MRDIAKCIATVPGADGTAVWCPLRDTCARHTMAAYDKQVWICARWEGNHCDHYSPHVRTPRTTVRKMTTKKREVSRV